MSLGEEYKQKYVCAIKFDIWRESLKRDISLSLSISLSMFDHLAELYDFQLKHEHIKLITNRCG